MLSSFPYKDLKEMDDTTKESLLLYLQSNGGIDIKIDSNYGFIICCDLEVASEFMDLLEIFPPLTETRIIDDAELSPQMLDLKKKLNIKQQGERLIADIEGAAKNGGE